MARCSARSFLKRGWNPYIAGSRLTSNETKRILGKPVFLGSVVEPSSARRRLIKIERNVENAVFENLV